jgi:hypothetical protein
MKTIDQLSEIERAVLWAWIGWGATYAQHMVCPSCSEFRYCRSPNGRRFLCLACFDQR